MSLVDIIQSMCCRRRRDDYDDGRGETRRERAARILENKRREIYERARERAKVAPEFVQELGGAQLLVESKPSKGGKGRLEAKATPPVTLNFTLPDDYVAGQPVLVNGPHGPMQVAAPPNGTPGSMHHIRLGPPPEFRLGVPKGAGPGSELTFRRPDGLEICVPVPPGKKAGDTFDVPPPALMVRVPEGAKTGDDVVFCFEESEESWCRAKVPDGVPVGAYFAARLPPPEGASKKVPTGKVVKGKAAKSKLADDPAVEPEWTEVIDPKTGKSYFWNKATGKTSWTDPCKDKQSTEQAISTRIKELEAAKKTETVNARRRAKARARGA